MPTCPFCGTESQPHADVAARVHIWHCPDCGPFRIDRALETQFRERMVIGDDRYLVHQWLWKHNRNPTSQPIFSTPENIQVIIDRCPRLPRERQAALFRYMAESVRELGEFVGIIIPDLIRASYCRSEAECRCLLSWLERDGLIEHSGNAIDGRFMCSISPKGYDAYYEQSFGRRLTVFVSSTCYDLLDLRFELAAFLESKGHSVKLSDDPERFAVDPADDSIETCLRNLETSDVVICLIDRRYGGVLSTGDRAGRSATHVEVLHARDLRPPKPVFFFMRERAWLDYDLLRQDADARVKWVEPDNANSRGKWREFVRYVAALPEHAARSNWVTLFKSSTDLKPLVIRRLMDFVK